LLAPRFTQMGHEEPRKVHWVGREDSVQRQQDQGGKNDDSPKKNKRGYRDLSSITLGEVNDAHQLFSNQLLPSPYPAWVAANYFCMVNLVRKRDERPPAIFGRVKTCYPSDGYIQNIQEMELFFPRKDGAPEVILLQAEDILHTQNKPVQSYCVRVKLLVSPEDKVDFDGYDHLFFEKGFVPEFNTGYIDLLEVDEHNHGSHAGLCVIGSRWFASLPASIQPEIREKLTKLIHWNKLIFNYHPDRLPIEIKTLNRELGYKAGFTDIFILEPETPQQTAGIIASAFEKIFHEPVRE